jgi:hypothetical protein
VVKRAARTERIVRRRFFRGGSGCVAGRRALGQRACGARDRGDRGRDRGLGYVSGARRSEKI